MDRSVLESDPHRVLEGMAIAAYAVGASSGLRLLPRRVPARGDPPAQGDPGGRPGRLPRRHRSWTPSSRFEVDVRLGAGAFVCGEETALIASIEGGRGTPTPRPPYPAVAGLWDRPTLINNVETFANIAPDHPQRRRVVRRDRHGEEQGHQGLRPRRPGRQHRPHRGPDGHDPARDRVRHRRRHRRRPAVQGGPDRRPVRRLHPRPVPRHAGRLRVAASASARSWARAA